MSKYKSSEHQYTDMSHPTSETKGNTIKHISVKESTWRALHDLKDDGQRYDDLISRIIRHERDYREGKMIGEIDSAGEFVAFEPEVIMNGE